MKPRVLIVDDSGLSRRTLRQILEPAGYEVVEAEDGLTALERYALLPEARRWVQTFQRNGILHLRVHNEPTTVSLFTGIISDIDGK